MFFTKEYVTGIPLNLKKHTLGYLKQPIVDDFMYDFNFIDFIKPYYVGMVLSYEKVVKEEGIPFSYFLSALKKDKKMMDFFYKGLTIIYETTVDGLNYFNDEDDGVVLIVGKEDENGEYEPVSFISDRNFILLCEVVLEMCSFDKPKEEGEIQGDPEKVKRFKEQQRKFFQNKKSEDDMLFENMVRETMHFEKIINYDDIKNMTIWKLRDIYKVDCMEKNEHTAWQLASGGRYDTKQIKSWQKLTKLKK